MDRSHTIRRGDRFEEFVASGWAERLARKETTQYKVADELGVTQMTVSRWLRTWLIDEKAAVEREGWTLSVEAEQALHDFRLFSDLAFRERRTGKPFVMEPCHLEWIDALYEAYRTGGQVAIIAAPRHGKTTLLVRFVCWLIVKHPNISIIWVSKSQGLAELAVGLVKAELEDNERLISLFLPPGERFQPARFKGKWTDQELTVATRTAPALSPTLVAIGSGGSLLSRDADFLIGDDIEDDKSTAQPGQRETTQRWWSKDVESRKEEHTGWVYIGSPQHPEDLVASLRSNSEWRTLIYPAHAEWCVEPWTLDGEEPNVAGHVDCLLAPRFRSFRYLWKKRQSIRNDAVFEMQYLCRPTGDGMVTFERALVESSLDRSRSLGTVPARARLIAGVDPASAGNQAAILWAVDVESGIRYLVDLENRRGGGVQHLRWLLQTWSDRYPNLRDWVIEENIAKDTLSHDRDIREIKSKLSLRFVQHHTGRNKWDLRLGVPGMVQLFKDSKIVLPFGDVNTRQKVTQYVSQLVGFSDRSDSNLKYRPMDLVMAGWFPEKEIQSWLRPRSREVQQDYEATEYPWLGDYQPMSVW